jgi:hypothetical protein
MGPLGNGPPVSRRLHAAVTLWFPLAGFQVTTEAIVESTIAVSISTILGHMISRSAGRSLNPVWSDDCRKAP